MAAATPVTIDVQIEAAPGVVTPKATIVGATDGAAQRKTVTTSRSLFIDE